MTPARLAELPARLGVMDRYAKFGAALLAVEKFRGAILAVRGVIPDKLGLENWAGHPGHNPNGGAVARFST